MSKAGRPARRLSISLWLIVGLAPPTALAQTPIAVVPTVLQLPPTVRSAALNGAAVALVGDAGAVFANPAGLATISHIGIEGAYRTMPGPDAFLLTGALGWRLRQFNLGVGLRWFDMGAVPSTYLGPAVMPGTPARDALAAGSLVYRFGLIALGGTVKYLEREVAQEEQQGVSVDAGAAIAVFDIMAIAFSVQNVGGNLRERSALVMPRFSRLGFTMNYVDPQGELRLLSTLEVQWPDEEAARLVVGGEAGLVLGGLGLIGRVGWGSRPTVSGRSQGTFGASVAFSRLRFDYAYQQSDILDEPSHQVGLRLTL